MPCSLQSREGYFSVREDHIHHPSKDSARVQLVQRNHFIHIESRQMVKRAIEGAYYRLPPILEIRMRP